MIAAIFSKVLTVCYVEICHSDLMLYFDISGLKKEKYEKRCKHHVTSVGQRKKV